MDLPSPEDKKPGVGCNLKPTTDSELSSILQKLETLVLQHSQSRLFLNYVCNVPRLLQLELAVCPLLSPVGVREWAAEPPSFSRDPLT